MPELAEPDVLEQIDTTNQLCPNYHVIFLNDDYHTMHFVVYVMMAIFRKTGEEAADLTLKIHNEGQAIITTVTKERAELYLEQVSSIKEGEKGAIGCVMEPAE